MNFLTENARIKNYVIDLAVQAIKKSKIHPVDREFLNSHLSEILSIDPIEFLYHNFQLENDLYANQLFACLPEVWKKVSLDDILEMSHHFTSIHSYFTLIRFTYKYIEIDIIEPILGSRPVRQSQFFFDQIIDYLNLQWNVLVKSQSDFDDFEDGFIDVSLDEWMYIKQKFLTDKRVKPALTNIEETRNYIMQIVTRYGKKGGSATSTTFL